MKRVRITVLRKEFFPDLAETYLMEGRAVGPCPLLNTGETFIYEGGAEMPKDFCPWAWIDIYRGISAISAGATYVPWNRKEGQQILCCTDGVRPVVFLVEALED